MFLTNLTQSINHWLAQATWIDQAARPVQKAINAIFQGGGAAGRKIGDLLNGTWLGHPLHPVLTDIPIGAWATAVTLDAMEASSGRRGVAKAADAAVALGIAGAAGSAISGIADWQYTIDESRRTGFIHATLNTLALGLFIASLVARKQRNRSLGRSLALTGFGIASLSAYLGGDLVYRQKIGVNHAPEEVDTQGFVPILAADQLPENKLRRGMLNNVPLVLLRRGDRVYALAETCAHLGGPLANGELEQSPQGHPVVVCPWHRSRYDMENGDVLDGPSAYAQPCFEARIQDGQIEVRRRPVSETSAGEAPTAAGEIAG